MDKNEVNDKIISMSESVLYNEQERKKLLNNDNYKDIKIIINILNVYMKRVINTQNDLDKSLFDYINKLNELNGYPKYYDYSEYLKKEFKVSRIVVIKILCDPLYFRMFVDFNNHRDIFKEEKKDYLLAMDSFVKYMELENKQLKDVALRRYQYIVQRNSLEFSRRMLIPGDKVIHNIDKSFESCIMNGIDLNADKLTIARYIYLKLCYGMRYDIDYTKYDLDYENPFSSVDTKTLCWANIYASLLNKLEINAMVCGEEKKYVILEIDGVYIKADALSFSDANEYKLNDLLRIKMSFTSNGFMACDSHNDITKLLEDIDDKIGIKLDTIANFKTKIKNHYQDNDMSLEMKKKISLLLFYLKNINTLGMEWLKHMEILVDMIFNLEDKKAYCTEINIKNEKGKFENGIVVALEYNNEWAYFCLKRKGSLKLVSKKLLLDMLNSENILLNDSIKGLETETEMILKKNKNN